MPFKIENNQLRVGLSWDPNQVVTAVDRVKNMMGRNTVTFDLDISCYVYGPQNDFQDFISGLDGEMVGKSGCIRHSGDNLDGIGDGDDEFITIDLNTAPDYINNLVFVIEVASAHAFKDIISPSIQVREILSGSEIYQLSLVQAGQEDRSACIALKIGRNAVGSPWVLSPIESFVDHENIEDWANTLNKYLN